MATPLLSFAQFVDTTSSEQLWQIYNATGGFNIPPHDQIALSNYNGATPAQPGLVKYYANGVLVATVTITYDGSNNITNIVIS